MEEQRDPPAESRPQKGPGSEAWERDLIERLAMGPLKEQRYARRWSIFFKSLLFVYLAFVLIMVLPDAGPTVGGGKHTALIEVRGVIADDRDASADNIIQGLRQAFRDPQAAGVILRINSPGGSPVQAGYVADEIARLRAERPEISVYAVVTDVCASGGYYIASAADQIYADKASIVGSIGVLMDGFGFVDTMAKLGVERRLLTAGEHKGFLDPFSPMKTEDVEHVRTLLGDIHSQFVTVVKRGRGDRLKDDPALFSGLVWTGEQGLELGLVDALGSASYVAREVIGAEKIVNYTRRPDYLERFAGRFGATFANALSARFGLSETGLH